MESDKTGNQQTRKFNEVMWKLQTNSKDKTKSLTEFIEEIRTQAKKNKAIIEALLTL
jgi:hypothetical protein